VSVRVTGPVTLAWTLRRGGGGWTLWRGTEADPTTAIALPADVAWRVWTKGLAPDAARALMDVRGDQAMASPLAHFVAIMA
jgi:hypothetical protein